MDRGIASPLVEGGRGELFILHQHHFQFPFLFLFLFHFLHLLQYYP
ncbi:MAG: hypothetical protein LBQ59_02020 [Candidatus Peribacteria bacterium]|nr:hypothetical protein [Candidatus Peribacteria bacterium]